LKNDQSVYTPAELVRRKEVCRQRQEIPMKKVIVAAIVFATLLGGSAAFSQVKMTKEQMMFYTSDWKGDRFPDGRPKVPDDLLKRAVDCTIEDIWGFLRQKGYANQFEGDWQALHIEKPFAGRALTAQYMPTRADMAKAIAAEGKAEGRVSGTTAGPLMSSRLEMYMLPTASERSLKVR
jgi:4-hydroxy-4-methyl-2-oxoglutarate aldolase